MMAPNDLQMKRINVYLPSVFKNNKVSTPSPAAPTPLAPYPLSIKNLAHMIQQIIAA